MGNKVKVGISSCLLGEKVRYNGEHKLDSNLIETLYPFVEFVPICPEAEAGFGIPRETMQLIGDPQSPRLITLHSKKDLTGRMVQWTKDRIRRLENENLGGFIFKSKSPSCGMTRVNVYSNTGEPVKEGTGLFARAFMDHFPLIPTEDETRLLDPDLREVFIDQIRSALS